MTAAMITIRIMSAMFMSAYPHQKPYYVNEQRRKPRCRTLDQYYRSSPLSAKLPLDGGNGCYTRGVQQ